MRNRTRLTLAIGVIALIGLALPAQAGYNHCRSYPCPTQPSTTTTQEPTTTTMEPTTTTLDTTTTTEGSESSSTTTIPNETTTTPTVPSTSPNSSVPPAPARTVSVTCSEVTVSDGPVDFQLVGVTVTLDDGTYTHGGEVGQPWAAWEVDSENLIASGEVPQCELPFTGINATMALLFGIVLMAGGVAIVRSRRSIDEL